LRYGYFTPDDIYEAIVARLARPGCAWIDIGCGRDIFPGNFALAKELAGRCSMLLGVDDSPNLQENVLLHDRAQIGIEQYRSDRTFDLATMRMVAEHIAEPASAIDSISRLVRPGGKTVVYTINQWSPVPMITRAVPFRLHHPMKKYIWGSEEKDTFPVAYRMNTRKHLSRLFGERGFRESYFAYLDDCRVTCRFRLLNLVELNLRRFLRGIGLKYPENCLLGIYEKL
jgi:SAM-dependent methyltransferase